MHSNLCAVCSALPGIEVRPLAETDESWFEGHQGDDIPHGFNKLFYWLRTRGLGLCIEAGDAKAVVSYRTDLDKIIFVRPTGAIKPICDLVQTVGAHLSNCMDKNIWVRYCSPPLCRALRLRGWELTSVAWSPNAWLDDETWPEVRIHKFHVTKGQEYRRIRAAFHQNSGDLKFSTHKSCLQGTEEFCLRALPSSTSRLPSTGEVLDYISACFTAAEMYRDSTLQHHYLQNLDGETVAYAVTATFHELIDVYLASAAHRKQLMTYFIYEICSHAFKDGVSLANLGGSELESLHRYKTRSFGAYSELCTSPMILLKSARI